MSRLTSLGTNDIRSYFSAQLEQLPFQVPPNHSHSLFPTTDDTTDNISICTPEINLDLPDITEPPLHQQLLIDTTSGTYHLPWGASALEEIDWSDNLRWIYSNPNGIAAHETEFALFQEVLFERHCSISSVAETKLDTEQHWIQDLIRQSGRQRWNNVSYSTSCHNGPVKGHTKYGGTMMAAHGNMN